MEYRQLDYSWYYITDLSLITSGALMGTKLNAVYALKARGSSGRVDIACLIFRDAAAPYIGVFKERFEAMCPPVLAAKVRHTHGRRDWLAGFQTPFSEREVDKLLIAIANELGLWIYIVPAMSRDGFLKEMESYLSKNPSFDKPSNL